MTGTPRLAKSSATVDLPLAIPPVKPIRNGEWGFLRLTAVTYRNVSRYAFLMVSPYSIVIQPAAAR
jgi:hypothetical protein